MIIKANNHHSHRCNQVPKSNTSKQYLSKLTTTTHKHATKYPNQRDISSEESFMKPTKQAAPHPWDTLAIYIHLFWNGRILSKKIKLTGWWGEMKRLIPEEGLILSLRWVCHERIYLRDTRMVYYIYFTSQKCTGIVQVNLQKTYLEGKKKKKKKIILKNIMVCI